jgi:hypothetical protein
MKGLESLLTYFMFLTVASGVPAVICTVLALWLRRWRKWLWVLPAVYFIAIHVLWLREGTYTMKFLWNPLIGLDAWNLNTILCLVCSLMLYGMTASWLYMTVKMLRHKRPEEAPRERR